jgi:hypothetical protein
VEEAMAMGKQTTRQSARLAHPSRRQALPLPVHHGGNGCFAGLNRSVVSTLVPVFVVVFCDEHLDKFGFDVQRRGRGSGNTQAAAYMIGEEGAAMILAGANV